MFVEIQVRSDKWDEFYLLTPRSSFVNVCYLGTEDREDEVAIVLHMGNDWVPRKMCFDTKEQALSAYEAVKQMFLQDGYEFESEYLTIKRHEVSL